MRVGIITGSGSYAWPGLTGQRSRQVETGYGAADVTVGRFVGVDVVHLSRREPGSTQAGASGLVKVSHGKVKILDRVRLAKMRAARRLLVVIYG